MNRINLLILLSFFLTSCASSDILLTTDHFDNSKNDSSLNSTKLKEITSKDGSLGVAGYYAKAYPITNKYINLLKREKSLGEEFKDIDQNKSCFHVSINTKVDKKAHLFFKNWPSKIVDHQKKEYNIIWSDSTLKKDPTSKLIPSYHGKKERWFNEGIGCVENIIDLTKDFKMILSPKKVSWLLRSSITLNWNITQFKVVNDKKVIIKKKKQASQPYRNW